ARGLTASVRRRARGEPLQHILGWESFRGLRLRITRDVLVPRPETELLVEWALDLLPAGAACVIDVGTGSGGLALPGRPPLPPRRRSGHGAAPTPPPPAAGAGRESGARRGLGPLLCVRGGNRLAALPGGLADPRVSKPPSLSRGSLRWLPREVRDHEP